jgi:hypothetical protein
VNRFYVYKCVVDDGGAPCVDRGLYSLSICKPAIRSTARVGDVVFAFGSNYEYPANRLVCIARVTRKLTDGEYYELDEFRNRGDCIYERAATGRFRVRADAKFHGTQAALAHDLGTWPHYTRANSLVSNDFRYFGAKGVAEWKDRAPALTQLVENLDQGHRVNHAPTLRAELLALKRAVWQAFARKVLGKPLHSPDLAADDEDGDVAVKVCGRRCYYVTTTC